MGNRRDFDNNSNVFTDVSYISGIDTSDDGGRTMPSGGTSKTADADENWAKTEPVGFGKTEVIGEFEVSGKKVSPTVGWLVCTKGPAKGQDFRLHTGWNYIGRGVENEVNIPDPKVDRSNMAKIAYDHIGKSFVIAPGDNTRNLTYMNRKPLLMPAPIQAYEIITIGDTELIFIPLCGPQFVWEE